MDEDYDLPWSAEVSDAVAAGAGVVFVALCAKSVPLFLVGSMIWATWCWDNASC